jgi:D-psicose/D-tagatose/L-ribulose 3-epimerase
MNPIGANTWIWVSPLTDERLALLAPRVRSFGFEVIELPIENLGDWDPGRAREVLQQHQLAATTCAVMSPDRDLVSEDSAVVESTQAYLIGAIDAAGAVGARTFAGPIYSPVGKTWVMNASERAAAVARLIENLRPVAAHAAKRGVMVAIEPLNRFETSFMNTAEQVMEVVDRVGSSSVGVLLDTFHMNIEERDPAHAIWTCGSHLAHVHACGCDRGAPGGDQIPWPRIAAALREVRYRGPLVIESFTIENQAIARAAAIWRALSPTQDSIATDGLRFLRNLLTEEAAGFGPAAVS